MKMILIAYCFVLQLFFATLFSMESVGNNFLFGANVYESCVNNNSNVITIKDSCITGKCEERYYEDRLVVRYNSLMWFCGVFDGRGCDKVACRLVDGLSSFFGSVNALSGQVIAQYFKAYKNKFRGPAFKYIGSTAALVHVDFVNRKLFASHCGDSGIIFIDQNERRIIYQTTDHRPLAGSKEEARILDCGGYVKDGWVNENIPLSRSFGYSEYKKLVIPDPDIYELDLASYGPIVCLCFTKGFSKNFSADSNRPDFGEQLKNIVCKLLALGYPIATMSQVLIWLMDKNKNMDQIRETAHLFGSRKRKFIRCDSPNNVSLVVCEVRID